jgi:hypothetical protein
MHIIFNRLSSLLTSYNTKCVSIPLTKIPGLLPQPRLNSEHQNIQDTSYIHNYPVHILNADVNCDFLDIETSISVYPTRRTAVVEEFTLSQPTL